MYRAENSFVVQSYIEESKLLQMLSAMTQTSK
jgi:hypothetical protein